SLADISWWNLFQDPVLNDLIRESLKNGFDVRLASARLEEARALYGVARSNRLPDVGYIASVERARDDPIANPSGALDTKWTAKLGFSWEVDLWGRVRRLTEAAKAQYLATEQARR